MSAALVPIALASHQVIEQVAPRVVGGAHKATSKPKRLSRKDRRLARRAAKEGHRAAEAGRRAARGALAIHVDAYDAAALLSRHCEVWSDGADILSQREIATLATYEAMDRIEQKRRDLPFAWWLSAEGWETSRALDVERAEVLSAAEALATARADGFLLDD